MLYQMQPSLLVCSSPLHGCRGVPGGGSQILGWVVAAPVAAQGKGGCDQAIKPSEKPVPFTDSYRTFSPFYLWLHSFHYSMRTLMYFLREVFLS